MIDGFKSSRLPYHLGISSCLPNRVKLGYIPSAMTKNTTLRELLTSLGGIGETAKRLSDLTGEDIHYDRVYQWARNGRVPGWALVPLSTLAKRSFSKSDIADLTGPVRKRVPSRKADCAGACA